MNREIKFRAWDTIKKEWISSTCGDPFFEFYEGYIKVRTLEEYHEIQGGEDVECERWHEHPNAIVMQFTGLRDKNGVEVYEGDVIKVDISIPLFDESEYIESEVKFEKGYFHFNGQLIPDNSNEVEIIRNIYDKQP